MAEDRAGPRQDCSLQCPSCAMPTCALLIELPERRWSHRSDASWAGHSRAHGVLSFSASFGLGSGRSAARARRGAGRRRRAADGCGWPVRTGGVGGRGLWRRAVRGGRRRSGSGLVAVGLAGLREQDQRGGVGGLEGEGEVEQDERVGVPAQRDEGDVCRDPRRDDDGLADEKRGVPYQRANVSARRPKVSWPKAPWRRWIVALGCSPEAIVVSPSPILPVGVRVSVRSR